MHPIFKRTEGKLKVDYGMKDYYKYYKDNLDEKYKPVNSKKYNLIISEFNSKIVDLIINENLDFIIPKLNINLCIRKSKRIPRIKNGKLVNFNAIDWKTTNELWASDNDAKNKKIIIKFTNNHSFKFIFRIKALKVNLNYSNKSLYRFKACRSFQRLLSKRILDKNQDNFNAHNLF